MYEFEFHRPSTTAQALHLAREAGEHRFLAGGYSLVPALKNRLVRVTSVIDISCLPELTGISCDSDRLIIGAMTTHHVIGHSENVRRFAPGLAQAASAIGDPHVRLRGTIGGSLANNDPMADYPAVCLALDATIVTSDRRIAADEFFAGFFSTSLRSGELITRVEMRCVPSAYLKIEHPAAGFALVGVCVAQHPSGPRVAVTGAGLNGVFRAKSLERALARDFSTGSLNDASVSPAELTADIHASAAYRSHLIGELARRGVSTLIQYQH
jgi:carbon-monoxide dehydrogenase medium subunit